MGQLIETLNARLPWLISGLLAVALAAVVKVATDVFRLDKIPLAGKELGSSEKRRLAYLGGAKALYTQGYQKFQEGVFRITTSRTSPVVVVSPKFLPELKKIPDTVLSFDAAVSETMEAKYTRIPTSVPIIAHTIKTSLTPSLGKLNPSIQDEVQEALSLELPSGSAWEELDINHALLRIVAMVSGRVFIGAENCRKEEYIEPAINYTVDVMAAQRAVQSLRPWLRPFLANRLPQVQRLDRRIEELRQFLEPVIAARKGPDGESYNDMLSWLVKELPNFTDYNSQNIPKVQLGLSFAAIHTTALTATNAFYDIVALPGFGEELREEAKRALAEHDGVFTSGALQSMKKMDSFLKETLRLYPASMASFQRKVLKPFTLSNGQLIPAGVTLEVPAVAVNHDSSVFPGPDRFDALRFYHIREKARERGAVEEAAHNQFVSVSQSSLTFGYGRHACPGRFFAANEIKMILANALLAYDFRMPDGGTERYPNREFAHMSIPDVTKKIMCRKIVS